MGSCVFLEELTAIIGRSRESQICPFDNDAKEKVGPTQRRTNGLVSLSLSLLTERNRVVSLLYVHADAQDAPKCERYRRASYRVLCPC